MTITTEEQLREIYGWPKGRAKSKVLSQLEKHSIHFIERSPFFVMGTYDSKGRVDASPKGGEPGFVKVLDKNTLLIPDTKGNNRVDGLVNIIETGGVGILFLIPGIDETLRINGRAIITTDTAYLGQFPDMQNQPKTCLVISVTEVFLHCAKAFMRSKLWGDEYRVERPGFPTIGTMLNDQLNLGPDKESQKDMVERYKPDL